MNWNAIQAVAELVAAIGVLASLLYLAVQVRQNTASVRADSAARVAESIAQSRRAVWTDPAVAALYERALAGKPLGNSTDAIRVRAVWLTILKDFEALFHQSRSGRLPPDIDAAWRKEMVLYFATPGGRDAVAALGGLLSEQFALFVREQLEAQDGSPLDELQERWTAVAEARASLARGGDDAA